jgi:CDP-glycerol glycerophosphotransferase
MVQLSVVIPYYNVETYFEEALQSLARQSLTDLEVIMVDDGSPDASIAIARRFAAADPRFRLVEQENGGLGHARNTGARHATGKYIAFVDSDDIIPAFAYKLLVDTMERTGSQVAAGNVRRIKSTGATRSPMHGKAFAETRLKTTLKEHRALLRDMTAWNKVYRRDFWEEHELRFPEGVLFEDAPATIPAYALAASIDVIETPIYYWRVREGGAPSITQRTTDGKNIADRLATTRMVSDFFEAQGERELKNGYDDMAIRHHLSLILKSIAQAEPEVQEAFGRDAKAYLKTVDDSVVRKLPRHLRLSCRILQDGSVGELLDGLDTPISKVPSPRSLLRKITQLPVRAGIKSVEWDGDRLVVNGSVAPTSPSHPSTWNPTTRVMWLRDSATRAFKLLPSKTTARVRPAKIDGRPDSHVVSTEFEAVLDPTRLQQEGRWQEGNWHVAIGIIDQLGVHKGSLSAGTGLGTLDLEPKWVDDRYRVVPVLSGGKLVIKVDRPTAVVLHCAFDDGALVLRGEVHHKTGADRAELRFGRARGNPECTVAVALEGDGDARSFEARVPAADLLGAFGGLDTAPIGGITDRMFVELAYGDQRRELLVGEGVTGAHLIADDSTLSADVTPTRYLRLSARLPMPVASDLTLADDGRVVVAGRGRFGLGDRLVLQLRGQREKYPFTVKSSGDSWEAEIAPNAVASLAGTVALKPGVWDLLLETSDADGDPCTTNLELVARAVTALPVRAEVDGRAITACRHGIDQGFIRTGPFVAADEQGPAGPEWLRRHYYPQLSRKRPLRDAVFYDCFYGRQFSDSPRAVYERLVERGLPLEHYWSVQNRQFEVPDPATAVTYGSRAWYEALATSRYIVTNTHLPHWFQRREGQTVVQTWHGTPLKKIAFDVPDLKTADPLYLEKIAQEIPNWSYLVSPNEFCTEQLPKAFSYDGPVLETGYPRNDIFYRGDTDELRSKLTKLLDLPSDKKLVLYAPTWRDNEFYGRGQYKFTSPFDFEAAQRELGDDHVMLVRRHPNIVDPVPGAGEGFVWDVSMYPDVAELLAVSDVLMTDYSSLMFDFANTGRPMLFFAYDLEDYRDNLRGFYFDFESIVPGPILGTTEAVVEALKRPEALEADHADRYREFQRRFCGPEDGGAADRLIDAVFR